MPLIERDGKWVEQTPDTCSEPAASPASPTPLPSHLLTWLESCNTYLGQLKDDISELDSGTPLATERLAEISTRIRNGAERSPEPQGSQLEAVAAALSPIYEQDAFIAAASDFADTCQNDMKNNRPGAAWN